MELARENQRLGAPALQAVEPSAPAVRRWRRRRIVALGEPLIVWVILFLDIGRSHSLGSTILASVFLAMVWVFSVRSFRRHLAHLEVAGSIIVGLLASAGATIVLAAVTTIRDLGISHVLPIAGAVLAVTSAWNWLGSRLSTDRRTVLVVGGARDGVPDLLRDLREDPRAARFVPIGTVAEDRGTHSLDVVPVVGSIADLKDVVREYRPDLIVVGVQRNRPEVFAALLEVASEGFRVVGLPEFYERAFGRLPVRQLTAAWFMSVLHLYQRPYSAFAKRAFDIVAALLIVLLFAPLFPLLFLMVALTPGAAVYRQTRMGAYGRPFTIFKFRTMSQHAETDGLAVWAALGDARVTPIGRVLRRARLDELPQVLNVLRGDMSIVGPRPERPEFVEMLESEVPFWSRRHLIKPGITGWAQIRGGYAADASETEDKLAYDLWYLRHASLVVDAVICLMTLPRILSGSGAR